METSISRFDQFESYGKHNEAGIDEAKKVIHDLPFKEEDIVKAYVGKPRECMCGCSGTYYYTKAQQEYGSKNRGYKVDDEDVDDAKVHRIYSKMKKNAATVDVENIDDYIYTMIIGQTQYTIYLKKPGVNESYIYVQASTEKVDTALSKYNDIYNEDISPDIMQGDKHGTKIYVTRDGDEDKILAALSDAGLHGNIEK